MSPQMPEKPSLSKLAENRMADFHYHEGYSAR